MNPRLGRLLGVSVMLCLISLCSSVRADERILAFHSDIRIATDGSMVVTETIRVRSEGKAIKRGIYRDFPTRYRDRLGNRYVVGFEVLSVERDGHSEPFHTEARDNGIRTYMGQGNVYLSPGEHSYRFSYRTSRQLGFFADHDELYWNVTGNGWEFPIDQASATVHLPPSVDTDTLRAEAYTGAQGARGQNYEVYFDDYGELTIATNRALNRYQGLTVVVSWPKGHVTEPTGSEKLGYFLSDNSGALIAGGGLAVLLVYYLLAWSNRGRDPQRGTIIPRFRPPHKLSPAAMRYLMKMGFDNRVLASALINMAVKGFHSIADNGGDYSLIRETGHSMQRLSPGEKILASKLFADTSVLELEQGNHQRIGKALEAFKKRLKAEYHQAYFITNSGVLVGGLLLSIAVLVGSGISAASEIPAFLFLCLWLSLWSGAVAALWLARQILFVIVFGFFELFGLFALADVSSGWVVALAALLIAINGLFYVLMKAPTRRGRKVMDEIEGFRMYLATAEQERLATLHPPEKTVELYEQYLPYALALDVEQEWSEQFNDILAKATVSGGYAPGWYSGHHWHNLGAADFSSELGSSLGSAISSASHAPGSSSGSGGGGSSGGGGGGGGGGGW